MLSQDDQLRSSTGESWLSSGRENIRGSFIEVREAFSSAYNALLEKPEVESKYDEKEVEEEEDKADEAYKEATDELDKILNDVEGAFESADEYNELIKLAQDYIQFAEGADASRELDRSQESKEDLTDDAVNFVDKLFNAVGDGLLNQRDKLYINEYILLKFKSHDFSKKDLSAFSIENNEVEYIMYGLGSSQENFTAAMLELFAFRFVINFVEAFTRPEVLSFGPYAFVAALRSALTETAKDMGDFFKNNDVFFFKSFPFTPKYKDYLRFFMFYHGQGNKVPRMMARIHKQTDKNLLEMPTYLEGEAEASIKLWFLPGITDMLGEANILNGSVENGEFKIRKKSIYSY
ncbi:DUF5702 domain-containing protein [Alkalicoccobacillus gibsonii]|uniref:DUF5702 domain-containing protein n=1 Tax=Alkalicoccobacillus gibsonii TaxID=79881 RepID=UPI003F7C5DAB